MKSGKKLHPSQKPFTKYSEHAENLSLPQAERLRALELQLWESYQEMRRAPLDRERAQESTQGRDCSMGKWMQINQTHMATRLMQELMSEMHALNQKVFDLNQYLAAIKFYKEARKNAGTEPPKPPLYSEG